VVNLSNLKKIKKDDLKNALSDLFSKTARRDLPRHSLARQALNFLWPEMGLQRFGKYYWLRIKRLPAASSKIAGGLAIGAAVSFTPLLGLHTVQAIVFAGLLRFNILAALLGTLIGNPVTFLAIFPLSYQFGKISLMHLTHNPHPPLFYSMLLGGYACGAVVGILTYFICYQFLKLARRKKI
jgi:uncharacterized protein (DUF2062 family)